MSFTLNLALNRMVLHTGERSASESSRIRRLQCTFTAAYPVLRSEQTSAADACRSRRNLA